MEAPVQPILNRVDQQHQDQRLGEQRQVGQQAIARLDPGQHVRRLSGIGRREGQLHQNAGETRIEQHRDQQIDDVVRQLLEQELGLPRITRPQPRQHAEADEERRREDERQGHAGSTGGSRTGRRTRPMARGMGHEPRIAGLSLRKGPDLSPDYGNRNVRPGGVHPAFPPPTYS